MFLFFLFSVVAAASNDSLASDPYLLYKPPFAQSLPVQILVTGVVFSLVAVLLIHLIFTGQYHFPLAPVNYILQLSGVITLFISLMATLNIVLNRTKHESSEWPYMVSYIAVGVPHKNWGIVEIATWLVMTATTSVLVQITHIQFLTLLYPSSLESRLIFSLLGPLAILSAVMQLLPISSSISREQTPIVTDIRNVCNATLSLLFTAALFIWGLLVNRANAWRTDGGTAVFGLAALTLALASTALNFLYVPREEEYVWLPGLMWAVTLWQSFLGWWWWVGAGSGFTTDDVVEKVLKRGERIRMKRARNKTKSNGSQDRGNISSNSSTTSSSTPASMTTLPFPLRWMQNLRHAHVTAAMKQEAERRQRIAEAEEERHGSWPWGLPGRGWGLGRGVRSGTRGRDERSGEEYEMDIISDEEREEQEQVQEIDVQEPDPARHRRRKRRRSPSPEPAREREKLSRQRSVWWWGPLARWRLRDAQEYS